MNRDPQPRPALDRWLLQALVAGVSFAALLPFAQGHSAAFGWLPLWLVGLPLSAWLGWHGLRRLDQVSMPASAVAGARVRRRAVPVQARRRRAARLSPMPHRHLPSA